METKNREKMLLIAVAVCVGLYLLNLLLISPLCTSWSARQDKIKQMKTNAISIEDKWNSMSTNTLPPNPTQAESRLYQAFQTWATSSQVILVGQRPQAKDSDDPAYSNEEWHADVTGSLPQIFAFLSSVESSPMGLKVDSVELSSRDDRGTQLALGLTVSGLILNPSTNSASN
jgi:hypothetical protein